MARKIRILGETGRIFAGLLIIASSGCSAEKGTDEYVVEQSVEEPSKSAKELDEPVYQGRAVFEESANPEFPEAFRGNWELERGSCTSDNDSMIVRVDSKGYRAGDGAMSIKKLYSAPGDLKRLIIDAIYSGGGEDIEQTVIVQMNKDGTEFRVWNKGEPEKSATIFYRCAVSGD